MIAPLTDIPDRYLFILSLTHTPRSPPILRPQYMGHIRDNAELAVRNLLRDVSKQQGTNELHAIDYMDDGTSRFPLLPQFRENQADHVHVLYRQARPLSCASRSMLRRDLLCSTLR